MRTSYINHFFNGSITCCLTTRLEVSRAVCTHGCRVLKCAIEICGSTFDNTRAGMSKNDRGGNRYTRLSIFIKLMRFATLTKAFLVP